MEGDREFWVIVLPALALPLVVWAVSIARSWKREREGKGHD